MRSIAHTSGLVRGGSLRLLASAILLCAGCMSAVAPAPGAPAPGESTTEDPAPAARAPHDTVAPGTNVYVRDEAVLRLDGPDGPVIGRALPGARLRVLAVDGGLARVPIAGHGHRLQDGAATELEAYIEAEARTRPVRCRTPGAENGSGGAGLLQPPDAGRSGPAMTREAVVVPESRPARAHARPP